MERMNDMTAIYKLEQWRIVRRITSSGASITCICGKVTGNPDFQTGTLVTTSRISVVDTQGDTLIVRTINGSEYLLGKPDSSEPFAKRRLIRYVNESTTNIGEEITGGVGVDDSSIMPDDPTAIS